MHFSLSLSLDLLFNPKHQFVRLALSLENGALREAAAEAERRPAAPAPGAAKALGALATALGPLLGSEEAKP